MLAQTPEERPSFFEITSLMESEENDENHLNFLLLK
jgi:hypothetical protein